MGSGGNERERTCPYCPEPYTGAQSLAKHIEAEHPEKARWLDDV